jgi:hypothetical protein
MMVAVGVKAEVLAVAGFSCGGDGAARLLLPDAFLRLFTAADLVVIAVIMPPEAGDMEGSEATCTIGGGGGKRAASLGVAL